MSIVFKILHIPSGEFITAFKSSGYTSEVMFYDSVSAIQFLGCIANQVSYISGGPIDDFYLGSVPIIKYHPSPLLSEFELLPFELETLPEVEQHRVLHFTGNSNSSFEEISNSILYH
jgi:hypothetical protein